MATIQIRDLLATSLEIFDISGDEHTSISNARFSGLFTGGYIAVDTKSDARRVPAVLGVSGDYEYLETSFAGNLIPDGSGTLINVDSQDFLRYSTSPSIFNNPNCYSNYYKYIPNNLYEIRAISNKEPYVETDATFNTIRGMILGGEPPITAKTDSPYFETQWNLEKDYYENGFFSDTGVYYSKSLRCYGEPPEVSIVRKPNDRGSGNDIIKYKLTSPYFEVDTVTQTTHEVFCDKSISILLKKANFIGISAWNIRPPHCDTSYDFDVIATEELVGNYYKVSLGDISIINRGLTRVSGNISSGYCGIYASYVEPISHIGRDILLASFPLTPRKVYTPLMGRFVVEPSAPNGEYATYTEFPDINITNLKDYESYEAFSSGAYTGVSKVYDGDTVNLSEFLYSAYTRNTGNMLEPSTISIYPTDYGVNHTVATITGIFPTKLGCFPSNLAMGVPCSFDVDSQPSILPRVPIIQITGRGSGAQALASVVSGKIKINTINLGSGYVDMFMNDNDYSIKLFDGYQGPIETANMGWYRLYNDSYYQESLPNNAWCSYQTSGENYDKVFSYNISLLDFISGNDGQDIATPQPHLKWGMGSQEVKCNDFELILAECEADKKNSSEDPQCVTGDLTKDILKSGVQGIKDKYLKDVSITANAIAGGSNGVVNIYSGFFDLNDIVNNDTFLFTSYTGDYTGNYIAKYAHYPYYNKIDISGSYPNDFSTPSSFINFLSSNLSGRDFWYDSTDIVDGADGYFEQNNNPLAFSHSGSVVYFSSIYPYCKEFGFQLSLVDRHIPPIEKYLLPSGIELLGSNDNENWASIDFKDNIDWSLALATQKPFWKNPITSGYQNPQADKSGQIGASGRPEPKLIYTLTVTGVDKCGKIFSGEKQYYNPPSGLKCPTGDIGEESDSLNDLINDDPTGRAPYTATFLKTGWHVDNSSSYNYYKIELSKLQPASETYIYSNEFISDGINLFGFNEEDVSVTGKTPLMGAIANRYIEGYMTGIITGTQSGYASLSSSGLYDFNRMLVAGTPITPTLFRNFTGHQVTEFTGVLDAILTGTGYYEGMAYGYYYNESESSIEFYKPISGVISGSGQIFGGPYPVINKETVNTLTESRFISGSGLTTFTGIIPNVSTPMEDVECFSVVDVDFSGNVISGGSVLATQEVSTLPEFAYLIKPTGYTQASSILYYNTPSDGDTVSINGHVIQFSTGVDFAPPTFFRNSGELIDIINSDSDLFNIKASASNDIIVLESILLGESGNSITLSSSGSDGVPIFAYQTMNGGQNIYAILQPTNAFTGKFTETLLAQGTFTGMGSGFLTGTAQITGYTRSFDNSWSLTSDFFESGNGELTDYKYLYNISGLQEVGMIPLSISYNNPYNIISTDVVRLNISGLSMDSGVSFLLTGIS